MGEPHFQNPLAGLSITGPTWTVFYLDPLCSWMGWAGVGWVSQWLATGQAMPGRKGQKREGSGGGSSRDKWMLRKTCGRSTLQPLFTINEEEEVQRRRNACKTKPGMGIKKRGKFYWSTKIIYKVGSCVAFKPFFKFYYQGQNEFKQKIVRLVSRVTAAGLNTGQN